MTDDISEPTDEPTDEPTMSIETITPDIAREWLLKNTHNRPMNKTNVTKMAYEMSRGTFALNGDAIRWSVDGAILDGQHRLHACILADKPFRSFVVRGLPAATQETMDIGKPRRLRDILSLRGEKNVDGLSAMLGHVVRIRSKGYTSNDHHLPPNALLRLLEDEPAIREFAQFGTAIARQVPISSGLAGALAYQFHQINAEDAEDFFNKLMTGSDLHPKHPVLVLRNRLLENKASHQAKFSRLYGHAFVVKAWNSYREGRDMTVLKWSRGGKNREEFPEPV